LFDKSEEDVSSAGEQLTSNKIYDGENTMKDLSFRKVLLFSLSQWLEKLIF